MTFPGSRNDPTKLDLCENYVTARSNSLSLNGLEPAAVAAELSPNEPSLRTLGVMALGNRRGMRSST